MPTSDIIGYLAENRQDLHLDTNADILRMAADLEAHGLKLVRIEPTTIFGVATGVSIQWVHLESEEWAELIHSAILDASVAEMLGGLETPNG